VNNQMNHYNRAHMKNIEPTKSYRSLCECELYERTNYDNDPEMKAAMHDFDRQTSQRFEEYNERLLENKQKCKEQCDKEIQKIILKDKLEKQMVEQFSTLQTDIHSDAIPTCICEKSVADKMEKGCLRCAGVLGGGVMPGMGLIDGSLLGAISVLQPLEIAAAKAAAAKAASDAATQAGIEAVISKINELIAAFPKDQGLVDLRPIVNKLTYNNGDALVESATNLINESYKLSGIKDTSFQNTATMPGELYVGDFAKVGATTYDTTFASQKPLLEAAKVDAVNATYASFQIAIIASIVAILVIVLAMVIIYLILRYRRKKKMKRKLQYIKLLKE
ncbi:hypothetical protein PFAG_06154, partial [Plasmodium falciparum Santa Lucia]